MTDPCPVHTDATGRLWINPGGGWIALSEDHPYLIRGGDGPVPAEPARAKIIPVAGGRGGDGRPSWCTIVEHVATPTDRAPVAPWRLWLRRLLRRNYPR